MINLWLFLDIIFHMIWICDLYLMYCVIDFVVSFVWSEWQYDE
jgi:hypothetical protein